MAFPICSLCDEPLSFTGPPHECSREKIMANITRLQDAERVASQKLEDMQNSVLVMLKEVGGPFEGDKVTVNAAWLRRLWDATNNCWYEAKNADDFLVQWMATHRILCEAYDVFRSKKYGHKQTLLQKLTDLREACDKSKPILGYNDSHFDVTPEDLAGASYAP